MNNQRGQGVVEYIVLSVVMITFMLFVVKFVNQTELINTLASKPWDVTRGMIENGVWDKSKDAKALHPNYLHRHISLQGE